MPRDMKSSPTMSTINDKIANDLKDAMRAKDQTAMTALRALKSALKYAAVEKLGADGVLDDADAVAVIRKRSRVLTGDWSFCMKRPAKRCGNGVSLGVQHHLDLGRRSFQVARERSRGSRG